MFAEDIGFHFCSTCGMIGREHLRALARPCARVLSIGGRDALSQIEKGMMPGGSALARGFNRHHPRAKAAP